MSTYEDCQLVQGEDSFPAPQLEFLEPDYLSARGSITDAAARSPYTSSLAGSISRASRSNNKETRRVDDDRFIKSQLTSVRRNLARRP